MNKVREARPIEAAGAVVFRSDGDVLLVHRPNYDDWALPKGKMDHDEYTARTAVREVAEEGAVDVQLGMPLKTIGYMTDRGAKKVHFWRATPLRMSTFTPNSEIDDIAWLPPGRALKQLSYADERHVLEEAIGAPETTPVLIVRHGKAMDRKNWTGKDAARPLTSRGRRQSADLVGLLGAYGVQTVASSASVRCTQTLRPYARQLRTDVQTWSILSEEHGVEHPKDVKKLMRRLVGEAVEHRRPLAVSGHRPVLPAMFETLGVEPRHISPATTMVAHLDPEASVRAIEWFRPLR